jgi:aspartate-semialdehyde dehydrogenase
MKIAVVGATGMVGQVMLKVLEERNLPITELIPVASEKSVGKKITYKGKEFSIVSMDTAISMKPQIAIFQLVVVLLEYAPKFAEVGCTVIDNSSAWRMDPTKTIGSSRNQCTHLN